MTDIPWDKLGIPHNLRDQVGPAAPAASRMAAAKGSLAASWDVQLAVLYVCAATGDAPLRDQAVATLRAFPEVAGALSSRTHSKVIEFLAEFRPEPAVDVLLRHHRNLNDRTAVMLASRADTTGAEAMCDDHERLLITPDVIVALNGNPATPTPALERAISFLRMEHALPDLPDERGGGVPQFASPPPAPAAKPASSAAFDLDAEIEAALSGRPSPNLIARQKLEMFNLDAMPVEKGGPTFQFNFNNDEEFSMDLLEEGGSDLPPEMRVSIEKKIAAMAPGKKIKLAYLGNKETRAILLRDRNKQVALAVVKSGRMTDNEAANAAGNRNLAMDVLREISANREFMRKYPIKVALVNNPRTPPSVAVPLVSQLQKRDLEALSRNRNVSSVLFTMALKMVRQKNISGDKKE
ncbi:hypothetical protein LBMAG42_46050 [Deltaproteobacteria bacterium]|nr:hypothetical protein LBMAG42_46050 [Deltaproteobacteria bacterium]